MRVLLVLSKPGYPDPAPQPELFPQGIAYVAGALRAAGHEIFGCNISYTLTRQSGPQLLYRSLAHAIAQYQPQAIALGGLSADYPFLADALRMCRTLAPDVPLILGGGIVTADMRFIVADLRPDFAISGECEGPIVELLASLESGRDLKEIKGLAFWKDEAPVFNPPQQEIKSKLMPAYARPVYDVLGIEAFFQACGHGKVVSAQPGARTDFPRRVLRMAA
jgi:anaerobic magnesium-protoporphyrin IX monomethyl ester cyclase